MNKINQIFGMKIGDETETSCVHVALRWSSNNLLILFELCKWDTAFGAKGFKATKRHHLFFHGVTRPKIVLTCRHGVELPTRKKGKKTRIDKLRNFWTTASVNSISRESFKEHKEHFSAGACSFNCSIYSQISVDVTICCTDVNTKPLTGNLKGLN